MTETSHFRKEKQGIQGGKSQSHVINSSLPWRAVRSVILQNLVRNGSTSQEASTSSEPKRASAGCAGTNSIHVGLQPTEPKGSAADVIRKRPQWTHTHAPKGSGSFKWHRGNPRKIRQVVLMLWLVSIPCGQAEFYSSTNMSQIWLNTGC